MFDTESGFLLQSYLFYCNSAVGECVRPCSKYTLVFENKFEIKTGGVFQRIIRRNHGDSFAWFSNVPAFVSGLRFRDVY